MEYDGETLLLPIIIPGQVYPNNRAHKFYAPVEYHKSPLAVQAMHRASVIFNIYADKRQLILKRQRSENDEGMRRVSPRLAPPVTIGRSQVANALSAGNDISSNAQNIFDNSNPTGGPGNVAFSKTELIKLKRDELVIIYKRLLSLSDSNEVEGTKKKF